MEHKWRDAVIRMFGQEDLKYAVCFVSGDTANLGHGLAEGAAVIIVEDYDYDEWFNPYDYYVPGMCCPTCDREALLPPTDLTPMLGVVRLDEWSQSACSGVPLNVVSINENDLSGMGTFEWTIPWVEVFDVGDRVWRVSDDGTPDTTDTGTVTGMFEDWDHEVIWDSEPDRTSAHSARTLTYALR